MLQEEMKEGTDMFIIKAVLPDVPPVRDLNTIARSFDLPRPEGEDLRRLKALGLYGAIVGKAYYTGAIDLKQAIGETI